MRLSSSPIVQSFQRAQKLLEVRGESLEASETVEDISGGDMISDDTKEVAVPIIIRKENISTPFSIRASKNVLKKPQSYEIASWMVRETLDGNSPIPSRAIDEFPHFF